MKKTTAIDSSPNPQTVFFFRFSVQTLVAEIWAKNWIYHAILFCISCENQPYDFEKDHDNRFLSKFPRRFFFRFSIKTLVAEMFDIWSKTQIFSQSSTQLAHKLFEISVGGSNLLSKYFSFPLLWGSLEWLKFRLIRFLSKVIAKNKNGQILSDRPQQRVV